MRPWTVVDGGVPFRHGALPPIFFHPPFIFHGMIFTKTIQFHFGLFRMTSWKSRMTDSVWIYEWISRGYKTYLSRAIPVNEVDIEAKSSASTQTASPQ